MTTVTIEYETDKQPPLPSFSALPIGTFYDVDKANRFGVGNTIFCTVVKVTSQLHYCPSHGEMKPFDPELHTIKKIHEKVRIVLE